MFPGCWLPCNALWLLEINGQVPCEGTRMPCLGTILFLAHGLQPHGLQPSNIDCGLGLARAGSWMFADPLMLGSAHADFERL